MANPNHDLLNKHLDSQANPTPDDVDNREINDALKAADESIDFSELSQKIESSGEKGPVEMVENFQFSTLALDKILSDEKYANERKKLFEELSRRSKLDLSEGAVNTEGRFIATVSAMTNISKKELKEVAPITYNDLYAEFEEQISLDKSKKMLKDAGIKVPEGRVFDQVYEANQVAYAFHQKFGDPQVNFEQKLKEAAPEMNRGFKSLVSGKAAKFGVLAVMTVTTGGSNLIVKAGLSGVKHALKSEALNNVFSKGMNSFKSFLNDKGVDTKPLDNAMTKIKDQGKKIREKMDGSKWGRRLVKAGAIAAVGIAAVTIGDIDLEAVKDIALDAGADLGNGINNAADSIAHTAKLYGMDVGDAVSESLDAAGLDSNGYQSPERGSFGLHDKGPYNYSGSDSVAPETDGNERTSVQVEPGSSVENEVESKVEPEVSDPQSVDLESLYSEVNGNVDALIDTTIPLQEIMDGLSEDQLKAMVEANQGAWDAYLENTYNGNIPEGIPSSMPPEIAQQLASDVAYEYEKEGFSSDLSLQEIGATGPVVETGSFGDWSNNANTASPAQSTPGAPEVENTASPSQSTPGAPETSSVQKPSENPYMDPRDNLANAARIAAEADVADVKSDFVVNEIEASIVELKVESGSSVYETVKAHLTEVNGMPPSEQAIMQATSDIIAENGIEDASKVQAGFTFDFRAEDYAYVTSVSQDTVDIARFGADGIPDGLKGQTLSEIASGKFEGAGPVDTRATGHMMAQDAVRAGVKADIQSAIDKGLDPDMSFAAYVGSLESRVAQLDPTAPGLASKFPAGELAASVPDGHAGPTEQPGNPNAMNHYAERQREFRADRGLGR